MAPIRIVLAEDHSLVREGTRQILEQQPDLKVVGETDNGLEAITLITDLRPNVAILDIRMPGANAIEVTREVRELCPETQILILTAHVDDDYVVAALEAGAQGYLLKTVRSFELVSAVRSVNASETVLHPAIAARLTRLVLQRNHTSSGPPSRDQLSPRELEVLQRAAEGLRNREIAEALGVSSRTVEGHFSSILNKLGVSSRTAAVMQAMNQNWFRRE